MLTIGRHRLKFITSGITFGVKLRRYIHKRCVHLAMEAIQKRVTKIERATVGRGENQIRSLAKRRVAAYARVSTDSDEQFTSFEAEMEYYTRQIATNMDWTLVEVYTDADTSCGSTH